MSKILFRPLSLLGGLVAAAIGRRLFESLWSLFGREQPPDPKDREVPLRKAIPALLLEGAVLRAARGIADRASREAFSRLTGAWPGEERAEQSG
jgi:hypothetical protein